MSFSIRASLSALSIASALFLPMASVQADPTRIDFGGHVTSVDPAAYPGVAVGAPVSGFVVYESSASGQAVFSTPPYGFSFDFAGTVVASTALIQFVADENCFSMSADCVRFGEFGRTLNFIDLSRTLLSSNAMPDAAVLSSFPIIGLSDDLGGRLNFYASIDQLTIVPVPEPGAFALMLAGLGVIASASRRLRHSDAPSGP